MVRTGVNAVEVVQIRSEAQSLNCSLNVRLDVRGRVGHGTIFKGCETTLGGDCMVMTVSGAPLNLCS